ncbi:MAG: DUF4340 domain-containing protein, partial [Clostridia bacterium]|nr:DUF4340 domain-containing protein [Clostridia bacterium]
MKSALKLIGAVAALAVLIGGYVLVNHLTKTEEPATQSPSVSDKPFLSVNGSLQTVDYTYNGEQIVLNKTADGWSYAPDANFPLSADATSTFEIVLSDIEVLRTILPEEADLDLFGLTSPSLIVTVTTDAETATYTVGAYNKSFNGYYLQKTGDPLIYLVAAEMPAALSNGLYAIAKVDAYPQIMSTNVTALTIQTADASRVLTYLADGSAESYSDTAKWFDITNGKAVPVRETAVTVLAAEVTGLEFGLCVDYAADEAERAAYGFSAPWLQVSMEYNYYTGATLDTPETTSFTLTVGNALADGSRYLTWSGTKMVYTVTEDAVAEIVAGLTDDLGLREVCAVSANSIATAIVSLDGVTTVIEREEREIVVEGADVVETTVVYTVDGALSANLGLDTFFETLTTMEREATAAADSW